MTNDGCTMDKNELPLISNDGQNYQHVKNSNHNKCGLCVSVNDNAFEWSVGRF